MGALGDLLEQARALEVKERAAAHQVALARQAAGQAALVTQLITDIKTYLRIEITATTPEIEIDGLRLAIRRDPSSGIGSTGYHRLVVLGACAVCGKEAQHTPYLSNPESVEKRALAGHRDYPTQPFRIPPVSAVEAKAKGDRAVIENAAALIRTSQETFRCQKPAGAGQIPDPTCSAPHREDAIKMAIRVIRALEAEVGRDIDGRTQHRAGRAVALLEESLTSYY